MAQQSSDSGTSTTPANRIGAVLFDAYGTLFDVFSVGALAERLYPGHGAALAALWRDKQVEYTRLRTLSDRYKAFDGLTEDALEFSCRRLGLPLDGESRARLMAQYAELTPFPENLDALRELRSLGIPMAILSNGTPRMLEIAVQAAGMTGLFDHLLSVDVVRRYKTAAEAYRLGVDAFEMPPRQMLFVSSNGWDACGATWYGYTTFWINRSGAPAEQLDVTPSYTGTQLTEVVDLVKTLR